MKTLVLGLGNPILGDDSAGFGVVKALEGRIDPEQVTLMEASLGGLNLLDIMVGYNKAIIVDAIQTRNGKPGQIYRLEPSVFNTTRRVASSHDVTLTTAIELGKQLGVDMPQDVVIFAIEVREVGTFTEQLTPEVERAIPICAEMILKELRQSSP